jgi:hypothetical protein
LTRTKLDWFDRKSKDSRALDDLKAKREYFEQEFATKWDVGALVMLAAV